VLAKALAQMDQGKRKEMYLHHKVEGASSALGRGKYLSFLLICPQAGKREGYM
jgi:hypothetical protein